MGDNIERNPFLKHSCTLFQLQNSIGEITYLRCEPKGCEIPNNHIINNNQTPLNIISSESLPPNATQTQNGSQQVHTKTAPTAESSIDTERMIDAALLLTSIADIASKEVFPTNKTTTQSIKRENSSSESPTVVSWPSHAMTAPTPTTTTSCPQSPPLLAIAPRTTDLSSMRTSSFIQKSLDDLQRQTCQVNISRKRLLPDHTSLLPLLEHRDHSMGHISVTPPESPSQRPRTISASSEEHFLTYGNTPLQPQDTSARVLRQQKVKTILRKKFSWKNYPELESFLIANREEYLRHSTLNYTVQQKQYNNKLTERMIELASEHGYIFDEDDFSFVTVRDRIRCYYKSYVQSLKKRGMIIGYAARKAGLVSEKELEQSAATAGKIIVP